MEILVFTGAEWAPVPRSPEPAVGPLAWQNKAACLDVDPEMFYPERGGSSRAARAICAQCAVRRECLLYALKNREQFGIWGGTSERQRRKLRRLAA